VLTMKQAPEIRELLVENASTIECHFRNIRQKRSRYCWLGSPFVAP